MKRVRLERSMLLVALAACHDAEVEDAGVDASPTDATSAVDLGFATTCDDAGLQEASLPPISPSCAPCPMTMPEGGSACDAGRLECEYGNDMRVGCNPMAVCAEPFTEAGARWFVYPDASCGPIVRGSSCNSVACVDASVWCLADELVCEGSLVNKSCQPFRDAALGCPCNPDQGNVMIGSMTCEDGRYVIATLPPPPTP
jgi:hypothetical protein